MSVLAVAVAVVVGEGEPFETPVAVVSEAPLCRAFNRSMCALEYSSAMHAVDVDGDAEEQDEKEKESGCCCSESMGIGNTGRKEAFGGGIDNAARPFVDLL